MFKTILVKRGTKDKLPSLLNGEIAYCYDVNELYIGDEGNGNQRIAMYGDVSGDAIKQYVDSQINMLRDEIVLYVDTESGTVLSDAKTYANAGDVATLTDAVQYTDDVVAPIVSSIGDMNTVPTASKVVSGAITELFTNVSDGKDVVAAAITDKGVVASGGDTFDELAAKIAQIVTDSGGIDTGDATAIAATILAGYTAYARDVKLTGTMPNKSGLVEAWAGYETVTVQPHPQSSSQALVTVPNQYNAAGYYDGNSAVTVNVNNLIASNIKDGVRVGRNGGDGGDDTNTILGTFTSDATAMAAQLLEGYSAYVRGVKITGAMANRGAITPSVGIGASGNTLYVRLPQGGYVTNASGGYPEVSITDDNWITSNIRAGVYIFGKGGTMSAGKPFASGTQVASANKITITGLAFAPKAIIVADADVGVSYHIRKGTYLSPDFGGMTANYYVNTASDVNGGAFTVTTSGFTMLASNITGINFYWIAIG